MASITLTGRVGGRPGTVTIEIENLNWLSYSPDYTIAQDALPSQFFSITISTEKGSFVWYPPEPEQPSWWKRLLGKLKGN